MEKSGLFRMGGSDFRISETLVGDELSEVDHPVGIAIFIVIPGHDLHEFAVDHIGVKGIEDTARWAVVVVGRDGHLLGVIEDTLERTFRSSLHRGVDLLLGRRFLDFDDEVHKRDIGRRDANGEAVQLTLEDGEYLAQGLGRAGGGRNHREGGRARPAQIRVWQIEDALVIRVGVNRRHQTLYDPEIVEQDLGHGRQTVRGTRGIGKDVILVLVVLIAVDAHDDRLVRILGRCADDDLLGAALQVNGGILSTLEDTGALHDDVYAELFPGIGLGIAQFEELDRLAIDDDRIVGMSHTAIECAMNTVILEKVCHGLGITQVVDGDDVDLFFESTLIDGAEDVASNAAKTIDCKFSHEFFPRLGEKGGLQRVRLERSYLGRPLL